MLVPVCLCACVPVCLWRGSEPNEWLCCCRRQEANASDRTTMPRVSPQARGIVLYMLDLTKHLMAEGGALARSSSPCRLAAHAATPRGFPEACPLARRSPLCPRGGPPPPVYRSRSGLLQRSGAGSKVADATALHRYTTTPPRRASRAGPTGVSARAGGGGGAERARTRVRWTVNGACRPV